MHGLLYIATHSNELHTHIVEDDVGDVFDDRALLLSQLEVTQEPCTHVPHLTHVGEDHMMLPLVEDTPPFWQIRVHAGVIHEMIDQDVQTPEVSSF